MRKFMHKFTLRAIWQTPERKGYRYSNLFFLDLLDATFDADDETGVGDVPLQQRHAEAVRLARSH